MNRGNVLTDMGDTNSALQALAESITLYRRLIGQEGHAELRSGLACALVNQGNALGRAGRVAEGLQAFGEAVNLLRQMVEREGRGDLRANLATAFMNQGKTLCNTGQLERQEEALEAYSNSVELRRQLVKEGQGELRGDLAWANAGRAATLYNLGRYREARAAATEAAQVLLQEVPRTGRVELRTAFDLVRRVLALLEPQ
jgi:tetratricopeptide (TPR) repeat protein